MADLYVDVIQSCADELSSLLPQIPVGSYLHFRGGYFGVGAKPLRVIDRLLELPPDSRSFYRTQSDREFLMALDLIPETPNERRRWLNPYSGSVYAFDCYGVDGMQLVKNMAKADRAELKDRVRAAGHFLFWEQLATSKELLITLPWNEFGCAYGQPLTVLNSAGAIVARAAAMANYSLEFFRPWLSQRMSQSVGLKDLFDE